MSELSILELETEHAELLPEREALSLVHGGFVGGGHQLDPVKQLSNSRFSSVSTAALMLWPACLG